MLLFFEQGTRGGISTITHRFGKANNKYMGEAFDPEKPSTFLTYLDANNLYGWAMTQALPVGDFKWMSKTELGVPCVLEVDLEYPEELHDLHNDYSFAPERLKMNGVEKLVPNLMDKKKYILHYRNLKLYESLGLVVKRFIGESA